MEWSFSEDQDDYAEALGDWLDDKADVESVRSWFESRDVGGFEGELAEAWGGVGISETAGGQGGGIVELALTAEALGRHAAPSGRWLATALAVPALSGNEQVAGEFLLSSGLALAVDSSHRPAATVGAPEAQSPSVDADGRVTGTVPRVLAGGSATHLVVPAVKDGTLVLRLVEVEGSAVTVRPRKLLDRSREVADIAFREAPSAELAVDADAVIQRADELAAVLVSADALGSTERMLEMSVEYSLIRHQFGVPIGSFQAVKHAAASMKVDVEAARSVIYYAAAALESEQSKSLLYSATTKAQVGAGAARAADSALTIHGAIGYTWEHDLHLFYKRARLDAVLLGGADEWNRTLADALELDG